MSGEERVTQGSRRDDNHLISKRLFRILNDSVMLTMDPEQKQALLLLLPSETPTNSAKNTIRHNRQQAPLAPAAHVREPCDPVPDADHRDQPSV